MPVELLDDGDGPARAGAGAPAEHLVAGRSLLPESVHLWLGRRSTRVALAAVVVVAAAVGGLIAAQRHTAARDTARLRAIVAPVREWAADTQLRGINSVTTGSALACAAFPRTPPLPADRLAAAMLARLPGYRLRSTVQSIDEGGHLCMLQVSVARGASVIVVRVQPASDVEVEPQSTVEVGSGRTGAGAVAVEAHRGRVVAAGWIGPSPARDLPLQLARAEATHW